MKYLHIIRDIKNKENKAQAENLQRFFKTKKGEYGEGDVFLGLKMAEQRAIVKKYKDDATFEDIQKLLDSKIHEYRMIGFLILVAQFENKKTEYEMRKKIYKFYLRNSKQANNWDLVDLSAPKIVGAYLYTYNANKDILYSYAKSDNIWQRRIAIVSTYTFIKNNYLTDALEISKILVNDTHDLIHKAAGWMLREVGKKDQQSLEEFLEKHYSNMPRTMLRYAIERFDGNKRKYYLNKRRI